MTKWVVLFLLFPVNMRAQTSIKGVISDDNDSPIVGASVIVGQFGGDEIIEYDISDVKGRYEVNFSSSDTLLNFQVRLIGYKSIDISIKNHSQVKNFILESEDINIQDVIVKAQPIVQVGDTVNYSVNLFAKEQDRSIADVLERLPGIEVLDDGRVLYQGKPINKYYIEGLDLLGGKYNLANENLPYKEVSEVQIIENHQPIKVLDSLEYSDKAALNIKLKKAYAFTGQAELGAGLSPFLWDVNVTPILLNKQQQLLASYQSNNIGDDISRQLNTLTIEDLINQFENDTERKNWLEIQPLNTPNFSDKRWLDNNANLVSINYLKKLKNDYEIRLNTSYLNDHQKLRGNTNSSFFLPTDTILLTENQYNQLFYNSLISELNLTRNVKESFVRNKTQFNSYWDSQKGNIELNNSSLLQQVNNDQFELNNKFEKIFPIGKQLLSLKSFAGYKKMPENLEVKPGQYEALLNNNTAYARTDQNLTLNRFFTNNSIGLKKAYKSFTFSPDFGFQYQKQKLSSNILVDEIQNLSSDFFNHLDWQNSKTYFGMKSEYRKSKVSLKVQTPLNYNQFNISDQLLQRVQKRSVFTFEPRLSFNYEINAFWKIGLGSGISNQFGNINQLHYGYILNNYRNIQRIDTPLAENRNKGISSSLSYKNPIQSLFGSIIFASNDTKRNLMYESQINENGATEINSLVKNNNVQSQNLNARISKYISGLNTNFSVKSGYNKNQFLQFINSNLSYINTKSWFVANEVDIDFSEKFSTEIEAIYQSSSNKVDNQKNPNISQQKYLLDLHCYPRKKHYMTFRNEFIRNDLFSQANDNIFSDFLYRFSFGKKKIDIDFSVTNIFNIETYKTINVNEFSYIETNFELRPRQANIKLRIPF